MESAHKNEEFVTKCAGESLTVESRMSESARSTMMNTKDTNVSKNEILKKWK